MKNDIPFSYSWVIEVADGSVIDNSYRQTELDVPCQKSVFSKSVSELVI